MLAGTTVKRASLHNADIIEGLDLHLGDNVYVEKGGEIIPKIVGVDVDSRSMLLGAKVYFQYDAISSHRQVLPFHIPISDIVENILQAVAFTDDIRYFKSPGTSNL